jgi:hypothetical protein
LASAAPRYAADALIVSGAALAPDDLAADHRRRAGRRAGGQAANPTPFDHVPLVRHIHEHFDNIQRAQASPCLRTTVLLQCAHR